MARYVKETPSCGGRSGCYLNDVLRHVELTEKVHHSRPARSGQRPKSRRHRAAGLGGRLPPLLCYPSFPRTAWVCRLACSAGAIGGSTWSVEDGIRTKGVGKREPGRRTA